MVVESHFFPAERIDYYVKAPVSIRFLVADGNFFVAGSRCYESIKVHRSVGFYVPGDRLYVNR